MKEKSNNEGECDCEALQSCWQKYVAITTGSDRCNILLVVWFNEFVWDVLTLELDVFESHYHTALSLNSYTKENWHELLAFLKYRRIKKKKTTNENGISAKDVFILNSDVEFIHFCVFLKELQCSNVYRCLVISHIFKHLQKKCHMQRKHMVIQCHLKDNLPHIIDYKWNFCMTKSVLERQHFDTVMSWLSTLGGACSALGDYDLQFAKRAGKISFQQMDVAVRIGDPALVSRCRLYIAISLIQLCKFKVAKTIIRHEYHWAYSFPKEVQDRRLINMCHGIWKKLQYERKLSVVSR